MNGAALLLIAAGLLAGAGQDPSPPWDTEMARRHYQAWGFAPDNPEHFVRFGMALALAEDWPESAEFLRYGLELNPGDATAHGALAGVYVELGDYRKAILHFQKASELDPGNAYFPRALARARYLEKNAQTAARLAEVVRANPQDPRARFNLALALAQSNQPRQAAEQLEASLRIQPANPDASFHLGVMLDRLGEREKAMAAYREALRGRPGWALARRELAWLLATGPDHSPQATAEAVQLAESICPDAGCSDPVGLDVLAAAYASEGDFEAAAQTAAKAVQLALDAGNASLAEQSRQRLELYQAGRAFRLP